MTAICGAAAARVRGARVRGARVRGRVAPAAIGLVAAGLLVVVPAAPASAAAQPVIAISGPRPGTTFSSPSVVINGSANFTADFGYSGYISDLKVVVTFAGGSAGSCENSTCGPTSNFSLTPSRLAYNGPYSVSVTADSTETLLATGLGQQQGSNSASTSFNMAVKPATPTHVAAQVNGDGTVTVSWARSSEPDVVGYQVQRRDQSKPVVGFLAQPSSGGTVSWIDTTTAQGGSFDYAVTAFRPGADGTANTILASTPGAATASVPVPPPPSTTVPPIGATSPGTSTTVAPAQAAGSSPSTPDLSAFLAQAGKAGALPKASGAAGRPTPASRLVLPAPPGQPDTYDPTLPFGAAPARAGGATGTPRVALPGTTPATSGHQRGVLFSFAGGLLLCVLGLAVRNANRRPSGPPPLKPVTLDGDGPYSGGSARAGVQVIPASVAAKAVAREAARAAMSSTGPAVPPAPEPASSAAADRPLPPKRAPTAVAEPPPLAKPQPLPPGPTVEEAVDYFRLLKTPATEAEVGAPVA